MSATKAIQQLNRLIGVTASTKPLTTVQIDTFARFLSQASQKKANSVLALVQDKLGPENYSLLMERILAHKGLSPIKSYDIGTNPNPRTIARTIQKEFDVSQDIPSQSVQQRQVWDPEKGWVWRSESTPPHLQMKDVEHDLTREVAENVQFYGPGGDPYLVDPTRAKAAARESSRELDAALGVSSIRDPLRVKSLKDLAPLDPVLRNAAQGSMQAPLMQRSKRTVRGIQDGLPLGSKAKSEFSPEEIRKTIRLSQDLPEDFAGLRNTALFGNENPLASSRNPLIELMRGQQIEGQQNFRPLEYLSKEKVQRMLSQGVLY